MKFQQIVKFNRYRALSSGHFPRCPYRDRDVFQNGIRFSVAKIGSHLAENEPCGVELCEYDAFIRICYDLSWCQQGATYRGEDGCHAREADACLR